MPCLWTGFSRVLTRGQWLQGLPFIIVACMEPSPGHTVKGANVVGGGWDGVCVYGLAGGSSGHIFQHKSQASPVQLALLLIDQ
jgi:hypothetical protein